VSILWEKKPEWSLFFVTVAFIAGLITLLWLADEEIEKLKVENRRLKLNETQTLYATP
jgi:hypothetical protein